MKDTQYDIRDIERYCENFDFPIWIDPKFITGFDKTSLKNNAERLYQGEHYLSPDKRKTLPNKLIAKYLVGYLENVEPTYIVTTKEIVSSGLYLITELATPNIGYTFPIYIKDSLDKEYAHEVLDNIYTLFIKENNLHVKNLLRIFTKELFEYGELWGKDDSNVYNLLDDIDKKKLIDIDNFSSEFTFMY